MATIYQFPSAQKQPSPFPKELEEALKTLPAELRNLVEGAMKSAVEKYDYLFTQEVSVELPNNTTEQQINSIKTFVEARQKIIIEILGELAAAKGELVLLKHTHS